MKIGIDIDGVLTDLSKFYLDYIPKYSMENNFKGIVNPDGYELHEILDLKENIDMDFWEKYDGYYTKKIYTREFASEVINKLKEENEIHIITARNPKEDLQDENWTLDWLKENNIYYDNLVFTNKKLEYCKENNIDLMIEDCLKNIIEISKIIPVICLDARYNKNCKGKNITRCYSWYDIYQKFKQ